MSEIAVVGIGRERTREQSEPACELPCGECTCSGVCGNGFAAHPHSCTHVGIVLPSNGDDGARMNYHYYYYRAIINLVVGICTHLSSRMHK